MANTITDRDLRTQIEETLDRGGAWDSTIDHDVEAITDEVKATYGLVDLDDVPYAEYWAIVEKHQKEG